MLIAVERRVLLAVELLAIAEVKGRGFAAVLWALWVAWPSPKS